MTTAVWFERARATLLPATAVVPCVLDADESTTRPLAESTKKVSLATVEMVQRDRAV